MSKKKKNNKRGKTFIGFKPKREDSFKIKKRRKEKKHRKKMFEEERRF